MHKLEVVAQIHMKGGQLKNISGIKQDLVILSEPFQSEDVVC